MRRVRWFLQGTHIARGTYVDPLAKIGKYCRVNQPSFIGKCEIGNFVACGGRLIVRSSDHHMCFANMQDWAQQKIIQSTLRVAGKEKGLVLIKSACWIGDSVIILPGASIGFGAVIGAGSVVTKSIPDFAIAVGNPAKVIRYRFDEEIIRLLLKTKWWDWSEKKIRENKMFFETDLTSLSAKEIEELLIRRA